VHPEDAFQPADVSLGFAEVALQAALELAAGRLFDQARQRLQDLVLGIVDVAKRVDEEIVQGLDVFAEESLDCRSFCLRRKWRVPRTACPTTMDRDGSSTVEPKVEGTERKRPPVPGGVGTSGLAGLAARSLRGAGAPAAAQ
jgi:hypothetical protein